MTSKPQFLFTFLTTTFLVLAVNYLASFFNYFFHILVGQNLPLADYSQIESLLSLSLILGITASAVGPSVIKMIASLPDSSLHQARRYLDRTVTKLVFITGLFLLSLYYPATRFLNLDNPLLYLLFGLQALISLYLSEYQSILQAKLKIPAFLSLGLLLAVLKNLLTYFFLHLGLGTVSPHLALLLSLFLCLALAYFYLRLYWPTFTQKPASLSVTGFWQFSRLSLFTNGFLILILITDTLFSRHFFDPHRSGIYQTASLIAKIVFYSASTVLALAFPHFILHHRSPSKLRTVLVYSIIFTLLLGISVSLILLVNPSFVISRLYGHRFLPAAVYLTPYVFYLLLYSLFHLLTQFFLSQNRLQAASIPALVLLFQLGQLIIWHNQEWHLIRASILSLVFGLILAGYYLRAWLKPAALPPVVSGHP